MVAPAVRVFGQPPVFCNARPLLFKAHAALERGSLIEAGCLLREGLRLYLHAECEYHDCIPKVKRARHLTAGALAHAICKAGHCDPSTRDWLIEIAGYANTLAHCGFVRRGLVESCIAIVHSMLDGAPHLVPPMAGGRV